MNIDPISIIRKHYDPTSEAYRLLIAHGTQVADMATELAEKHRKQFFDINFIYEAALLHDIGMIMTNAPDIGCNGSLPYICHGYLGAELLRKENLPRHALVAERHTGTGLSLEYIQEHHLPIPFRDMRPVSMEEQIICFADKFFSKTNIGGIKPIEKVRLQLAKYGEEVVNQFDKWVELFM